MIRPRSPPKMINKPRTSVYLKTMNDILFYDGKCSLCAGEIRLLSRLKNHTLELADIHDPQTLALLGDKKSNDLLTILHLKRANGVWQTGLDATVSAWRHTAFGWLLLPLRWPLIKTIADRLYYRWANKRACRLGYNGECAITDNKR